MKTTTATGFPQLIRLLFLALLIALPTEIRAATSTWTGTTSTSWGASANWGGTAFASGNDVVLTGSANPSTVTVGARTVNSITFSNGATVGFTVNMRSAPGAANPGSPLTFQAGNSGIVVQSGNTWPNIVGGSATTVSNIVLLDNLPITHNGSGNLTVNVPIIGAFAVNLTGTGTLVLSGTNTFSAGANLNGGILNLGVAETAGVGGPLGTSGAISFGGGTLQFSSANVYDYSSRFSTAASQAFSFDTAGQTMTFATALTSSGGTLTKSGLGTLTLSGANNYNGLTTVAAGGLVLSSGHVGGGAFTVNDGASFGVNRNVNASMPVSSLILGTSLGTTMNITLPAGNPSSEVITAGSLTLNGTNSIGIFGNFANFTAGQFPLIKYSGTIGGTGSINTTLASLPLGIFATVSNNVANQSIDLVISLVAPAVVWQGKDGSNPGNWDSTALNWTNSSGTTVAYANNDLAIFDNSVGTGPTNLNLVGVLQPASVLCNNTTNVSYTLGGTGSLGGAMNLTLSGSGSLTLATANSYTGGTTLNSGTLKIGNAGALGTGTLTVSGPATLDNTSGSSLVLANNNPEVWAANFTFTGTTNLDLGTGPVSLMADCNLIVNSNNLTIGGIISGPFALTKGGAGNLTLTGASTITNLTVSGAGTVLFNAAGGALPANSQIAVNNGSLDVVQPQTLAVLSSGSGTTISGATLTVSSQIKPANGTGQTNLISCSLAGSASLLKSGQGMTILSAANSYTGGTIIQGVGTLAISGAGTLGSTSGSLAMINSASSVLDLGGTTQTVGAVSILGIVTNGTLIGTSFNVTNGTAYAVLAGAGASLTKNGTGSFTLSGANTYTGNTTVNAGTLAIQHSTLAATSTITVTNGLLELDFSGTNTVAGLVLQGIAQPPGVYNSGTSTNLTGVGSLQVGTVVNLSTNAFLTSLALTPAGALNPGFTTNRYLYTATNAFTDTPTVTVTNADLTATNTLFLNGVSQGAITSGVPSLTLTLIVGSNNVAVRVVSQDLSVTNLYTVNVTKLVAPLSTNAYLTTLTLTPAGVLSPAFTTNGLTYTATNAFANNPVAVTATSSDANATLQLSFNGGAFTTAVTNSLNMIGNSLNLTPSPLNTVAVKVTAPDGVTTNLYTVNVLLQPSLTAFKLTNSVSGGNNLVLTWPVDHTGYELLTQTNNLNKGVSKNPNDWGTLGYTTTNAATIPITKTNLNSYYRLVYP